MIGPNNIILPSAQSQYLNSPELQERFKTYDSYVLDIMKAVQHKWSSGSGKRAMHKNSRQEYYPIQRIAEPESYVETIILSDKDRDLFLDHLESPREPNEALKKVLSKHQEKYYPTLEQKYIGVKVKKFKSYKHKERKNASTANTTCPNCLSTLVVELGVLKCSKDRFMQWEKDFLIYNKLNSEEKSKFILTYQDPNIFRELYEKWSVVGEAGSRPLFDCGYDARLSNPVSRYRSYLKDPILVKTIEKSLGRELTEEELEGEVVIWKAGNSFFSDYKEGRKKAKIPVLAFPTDLI